MLTTNPIDTDSRIINEATALSGLYDVIILVRKYDLPETLKKTSFQIKRIKYRQSGIFILSIFSSFLGLMKAAFKENPDIYHAHDLDGLLCAFLPAIIKRKTLVYDSHELWSDLTKFSNLRGIHWLLPLLENFLMLKVKYGITVNESLAKYLEKKYHKPFLSLYNYPDIKEKKASPYDFKKLYPGKKILLYLGNTIGGRGVEETISALKYLSKNIILVIVSDSPPISSQTFKKLDNRVYFLPAVSPDQVIATVQQADIGLALIQDNSSSYYFSSPNKLFQYMAAEIPVLGSNFPEFKKFIIKNEIGEVVNPGKPRIIARKIMEMLKAKNQKKYRRNLINLANQEYSWEKESQKLTKFYKELEKNI